MLPLKLTDGTQLILVDGHRGACAHGVAVEMAIAERARHAPRQDGWLRCRDLLDERAAEERSNEVPEFSPLEACIPWFSRSIPYHGGEGRARPNRFFQRPSTSSRPRYAKRGKRSNRRAARLRASGMRPRATSALTAMNSLSSVSAPPALLPIVNFREAAAAAPRSVSAQGAAANVEPKKVEPG